LPEGNYHFIISGEPQVDRKRRDDGKVTTTIKFSFRVEVRNGFRQHRESIGAWEDRYRDLLFAIGATKDENGDPHLSKTADVTGKSFNADIIHEADKQDPNKSWARIANIEIPLSETGEDNFNEDVPPPGGSEEDEAPF